MLDQHCVRFLQWALPQRRMHWPGFRRVRGQVCKRLQRRIDELDLIDSAAYRNYLQSHADEWRVLDFLCRITISRFYRDRIVLEQVRTEVLPALAQTASTNGEQLLRGWSAGCAMGEEAYTLLLIWQIVLSGNHPQLDIEIIGSDIDEALLHRARLGCYDYGSVKALPEQWLKWWFMRHDQQYCIDAQLRNKVTYIQQDIRDQNVHGPFHIIFCRNLAFTYFEASLQLEMLAYFHANLVDGGALIIGGHETLPQGFGGFEHWPHQRVIFRKTYLKK